MNASRLVPPRSGVPARGSRRSKLWTFAVPAVLGITFLGLLALPAFGGGSAPAVPGAPAAAAPAPAAVTPAAVIHGDLVVAAGHTFTIAPTPGQSIYYQGGNITVDGTLYITDVTLSFVQFVGPSGTALQRLYHILHFVDNGKVVVSNSTITTDVASVNAYAKLNLTINAGGTMSLAASSIAFPGWVNVLGAGANLTLEDHSSIRNNPAVEGLNEPKVLKGDNAFAPRLLVAKGAAASLLQSSYTDLYGDNFSSNGTPRPDPMANGHVTIGAGVVTTVNNLTTHNDSANLSLDWAYPSGITGGKVSVTYTDGNGVPSYAGVNVTYGVTKYDLGTIKFVNGTSEGTVALPFTTALTDAIQTGGLYQYLNYTGFFGVTPGKISLSFDNSGPVIKDAAVSFLLNPPVSNNITVVGAGSRLTTADTEIGLTFGKLPSSALSTGPVDPWNSKKISFLDGATGYLANLSVSGGLSAVFRASAVGADATSTAYLFRWAQFNLTGLGGVQILGGVATAHYAYATPSINNQTANNLDNNLSKVNPVLWGFVQRWDGAHAISAYGASGVGGVASLLLASNEITSLSLPDGYFLGNYHIGVDVPTIPVPADAFKSFNWSNISSYPIGVAHGTPNWGMPDHGPGVNFPAYFDSVAVPKDGIEFTENGTNGTGVRIGQLLGVAVLVHDEGTAPITQLNVTLRYNETHPTVLGEQDKAVDLRTVGSPADFAISWPVNDTVTGLQGKAVLNPFEVVVVWNNGIAAEGGGSLVKTASLTVLPSQVKATVTSPTIPGSLSGSKTTAYSIAGTYLYNGSQSASIELIAYPAHGHKWVLFQEGTAPNDSKLEQHGDYGGTWGASKLTPGVDYTFALVITYNGVNDNISLGVHAVPKPSGPGFPFEKILGEPLWLWLAITAAVVLGAIGFILFSRRQAAGKVVECGECGNLIPETAKVCPKCGAEFESDVVRCSRCSSTIPGNSQFCPECAAQLLGRPGDAGSDPLRQAYGDFTERFRAEAKKELGDNYNEGSFWDWWKRQPSYTPFSQWKLQQGQGTSRTGMTAPPPGGKPPSGPGGAGGAPAARPKGSAPPKPASRGAPPPGAAAAAPAAAATSAPPAPADTPAELTPPASSGALKPCPNCGKEIPPEYLVCPFCGSVTQ